MNKLKNLLNKILSFFLPILGGLLGAIGGAGNREARRIFIPLLITGLAYLETESILVITICSMIGALSLGYGIPDQTDSGSKLGAFFYNLFNQNNFFANILTRGTIGLLIGLSLISIPIIKKNWIIYLWYSLAIIMVNAFLSWRGFGTFKLFGKELSWVEFITWGLITLLATLIIKLK